MWQNHIDKRIGATVMKKILWSALVPVHVQKNSVLSVFEPEVHDNIKRQMVTALYKDENFTKRVIKKQ